MPSKSPLRLWLLLLPLAVLPVADGRPGPEGDAAPAPAITLPWRDDFAAAKATANKEDKLLLLNFTGSDWCVWCHRLRDDIFLTPAFADYAAKFLVLVELDFPRKKTLPPAVVEQNRVLEEKYGVSGYPTILLLSSRGEFLGRIGYMEGGPKTFIRELKRMAAAKPAEKK